MLNRQYTKDALADLKYVAIEVKAKGKDAKSGINGLFLGYKNLTFDGEENKEISERFVWIYSKKCVYLYSLKYYNIVSIEVALDTNGKTVQFSNFASRHKEAVKSMLEIIEALKEQRKIQPNGLIDVYKYKALPSNLKEHLEFSPKIVTPTGSAASSTSENINKIRNDHTYKPVVYKPKEIETFFIERTSKYPIENALKKMEKKIEKMKSGTYSPPKLDEILANKEKPESDTEKENNNADFYGGYGGMYGGG